MSAKRTVKARRDAAPEDKPGNPVTFGPYNSTSPTGTLPLTASSGSGAQVKEYHGTGPVLQLLMNDGRLPAPYYGQVARNNQDWNLTVVKSANATGNLISVVFLTLTSNTLWNTVNPQDGSWLHRNGYTLTFRRGNQDLATVDPGSNFGGGGSDVCGQSQHYQVFVSD